MTDPVSAKDVWTFDGPVGWVCPACRHVWSPMEAECSRCAVRADGPPRFCAEPRPGLYALHVEGMTCSPPCEDGPCGSPEESSVLLRLPAYMATGLQMTMVSPGGEFADVFPGQLQVQLARRDEETGALTLRFRVTPGRADRD